MIYEIEIGSRKIIWNTWRNILFNRVKHSQFPIIASNYRNSYLLLHLNRIKTLKMNNISQAENIFNIRTEQTSRANNTHDFINGAINQIARLKLWLRIMKKIARIYHNINITCRFTFLEDTYIQIYVNDADIYYLYLSRIIFIGVFSIECLFCFPFLGSIYYLPRKKNDFLAYMRFRLFFHYFICVLCIFLLVV